jgi:hypothetical protein
MEKENKTPRTEMTNSDNHIAQGVDALLSDVASPVVNQAGEGTFQPQAKTNAPAKVGRNCPCPCGGGKKYKKCCGRGQAPHSVVDALSVTYSEGFEEEILIKDYREATKEHDFRRMLNGVLGGLIALYVSANQQHGTPIPVTMSCPHQGPQVVLRFGPLAYGGADRHMVFEFCYECSDTFVRSYRTQWIPRKDKSENDFTVEERVLLQQIRNSIVKSWREVYYNPWSRQGKGKPLKHQPKKVGNTDERKIKQLGETLAENIEFYPSPEGNIVVCGYGIINRTTQTMSIVPSIRIHLKDMKDRLHAEGWLNEGDLIDQFSFMYDLSNLKILCLRRNFGTPDWIEERDPSAIAEIENELADNRAESWRELCPEALRRKLNMKAA